MKKIEHNEEWLKSEFGSNEYLNLYESSEIPGYYFYVREHFDPMNWYHILNHTGVIDWCEGMPETKVAEPVSIGPFWSQMCLRFELYVFDNFLAEHIPHEREVYSDRAWYKFKSFEPEKWLDDFIEFMKEEEANKYKKRGPEQLSLF